MSYQARKEGAMFVIVNSRLARINMSLLTFSGPDAILAIEQSYFNTVFLPQLHQGQALAKAYEVPTFSQEKAAYDLQMAYLDFYRVPDEQGVVILPLKGPMSRYSSWYNAYGNAFLTSLITRADREPSIKGIVIDAFTPGGTVDSTKALFDAIYNFKKPIVGHSAFVASAGLWALSGCNEIWLEDQSSTLIGSVGTMCYHTNLQKKAELTGEEVTIFRATGSPDKLSQNPYEPLKEETKAQIQQRLDSSQKEFVSSLRKGRGGKIVSKEALTGNVYSATEGINLGLADAKGTLGNAVQRVLELAK